LTVGIPCRGVCRRYCCYCCLPRTWLLLARLNLLICIGIILPQTLLACQKLPILLLQLLQTLLVGIQQPLNRFDVLCGRELLLILFGVLQQNLLYPIKLLVNSFKGALTTFDSLHEFPELGEFVLDHLNYNNNPILRRTAMNNQQPMDSEICSVC
jgi:hypothetical protein